MQNNVTDLSQKLQRSLDSNYNVVDMPAVVEIISALEKTTVSKELLETTRLGKYINQLRRRTSNESLAKRAKELLKKWRAFILPDENGQIAPTGKKRGARTPPDAKGAKRVALNGQIRELDFSDNSNCSVKDLKKTDVIFINSDSNSSEAPPQETPQDSLDTSDSIPKKRGRKKGSKNHKNLIIAAEESFSNKMAVVSRNSKVKTTQELLQDLQNRTTGTKPQTHQDIELRAAQLTESLSRIDQKLNPQKQINKNVTPIRNNSHAVWGPPNTSGGAADVVTIHSDDEIVDVVGTDPPGGGTLIHDLAAVKIEPKEEIPPSPLTIEGLLSLLPPINPSCLTEEPEDAAPQCLCPLPPVVEPITVQIVSDSEKSVFAPSPTKFEDPESPARTSDEWDEHSANCAAKAYLAARYPPVEIDLLHQELIPNVNGNFGVGGQKECKDEEGEVDAEGLFVDIVPKVGVGRLPKDLGPNENFQKYSISISGAAGEKSEGESCDRTEGASPVFREWHETLDVTSYNGDLLRILPYVIID